MVPPKVINREQFLMADVKNDPKYTLVILSSMYMYVSLAAVVEHLKLISPGVYL